MTIDATITLTQEEVNRAIAEFVTRMGYAVTGNVRIHYSQGSYGEMIGMPVPESWTASARVAVSAPANAPDESSESTA